MPHRAPVRPITLFFHPMHWRKINRWLHRELGYLFFGMTLIYALSGIALNHHVAKHWNPSLVTRTEAFQTDVTGTKENVSKANIQSILDQSGEKNNFKQYYFPSKNSVMIYLKNGHINLDLTTGEAQLIKVRNRPIFREMNFLHYNKPKKLWMWFSDLFAVSLIIIAVTGLFLVRGKKGITGRGAILVSAGILIPLLFLAMYLWL